MKVEETQFLWDVEWGPSGRDSHYCGSVQAKVEVQLPLPLEQEDGEGHGDLYVGDLDEMDELGEVDEQADHEV